MGKKYNWSQKVLKEFSEEIGLDEELAARLTVGFGSGAGRGELCGAIVGGIMALGLKYGDNSKSYIEKFQEEMVSKHKSVRCKIMLENNSLNKAEVCPSIIQSAIDIIDKEFKKT